MTKVLVVERDDLVLNTLKRVLELNRLAVETAKDAEEGIKKAKEIIPKVILWDLSLTVVNDNKVLPVLKGDEKLKNTPIIVLVNFSEELDKIKEECREASDFLIKSSYTVEEIVDKVKAYL